jgi:pimeloyl-ACP methyl ester carboxylesterase
MSPFVREEYLVGGVTTVVHTAGTGEPVVFFHGAGTVDGFDFAEPWTDRFRVIVPHHPGYGESGDDPTFTDLHDYVMHYLELFDALGLDTFNLVGFSLGGYLAIKFASEHAHRVKRLVLIAPYGLTDPDHPAIDIIAVPGEQLVPMLISNFDVLKKRLPEQPDLDFIRDRYREATTTARLLWERPIDEKMMRYLHRLRMPTLIVWGDEDRLIPVEQTHTWRRCLPNADVRVFKHAGHLVHLENADAVAAMGTFLSAP